MKKIIILIFVSLIYITAYAQPPKINDIEKQFSGYGLIDVSSLDRSIAIKLAYSTTENFMGIDAYGDLEKAYLLPEIARMLVVAQTTLKAINPRYSLIILDAARPVSIQRYMYSLVEGTPLNIYVANPVNRGGKHNYGVAVDVSIIDEKGNMLDMGSGFDFFGELSHVGNEHEFVRQGLMTEQALKNRNLLIKVMTGAGFGQYKKEWWHYEKYTVKELRKNFKLLDF